MQRNVHAKTPSDFDDSTCEVEKREVTCDKVDEKKGHDVGDFERNTHFALSAVEQL